MKGESSMMKSVKLLSVAACILVSAALSAQTVVREFDAPGPEARGLAWDGQYLWCADADDDLIYKLDPNTGTFVDALLVSVSSLGGGGITWTDDGAVWVTRGQFFLKIDAESGSETANFHCPGG